MQLERQLSILALRLESSSSYPCSPSFLPTRRSQSKLFRAPKRKQGVTVLPDAALSPSYSQPVNARATMEEAPLLPQQHEHHQVHPRTVTRLVKRIEALTLELLPIQVDPGTSSLRAELDTRSLGLRRISTQGHEGLVSSQPRATPTRAS